MVTRVNNDQTRICDFQQDIKSEKPSVETPSTPEPAPVASTAVGSQQLERSLRSRTTLNSGNLKAALNSRVGEAPSAVGREFQTAVSNILRSASRLIENTAKFSSATNARLNGVKSDAANFINQAQSARQRLEQGRAALSQEAQLFEAVGSLIEQLTKTMGGVQGSTNDLLYNASKSLEQMDAAARGFEQGAQRMNNGDARAIKQVMTASDLLSAGPKQISTQASKYGKAIDRTVTPLADQARSVSQALSASGNVDAFSLKETVDDIGDKAYKFKYDIGEKVGGFIDEYLGPLMKAVGTGIKNVFKSIFNPDRNPQGKPIDTNKLVSNTNDLRNTIRAAQGGDKAALAKLQSRYGYTLDTAPKPGQMLVASNFANGELVNGQVTAGKFPGGTSLTAAAAGRSLDPSNPADLQKMLFGGEGRGLTGAKKSITLSDMDGNKTTVNSMDEFKKVVAANREKLGIPANGGELIPVHISLEGGGGKGKRYGAAFEEMYNLGVIPASVSGTSAGAIAGALVAGGLDPREADEVAKDPALKKFFDATISGPGVLDGRELYRFMDTKLRELTGIKDRPVTFADLPMPLHLIATKLADSQAPNDLSNVQDRTFLFSRETTPNTPVAMAVVASAAVPGAFDPVEFVDVATGRTMRFTDGGVLDNFPIGYQKNNLPEIGISLTEPNGSFRDPNNMGNPKKLQPGNLISGNPFGNAKIGLKMVDDADTGTRDFYQMLNPDKGVFVLGVPTWNLQDFEKQNTTFKFEYDNKIDPALDRQTALITQQFFKKYLTKLTDANASGTNLARRPDDTSFTKTVQALGQTFTATRAKDSGEVVFRNNATGKTFDIELGKDRLNDWLADDASFGDLPNRLRDVLVDYNKFVGIFGI